MIRSAALTPLAILSLFYWPRFGVILTGYGHGGQMVGIAFALVMLLATGLLIVLKGERLRAWVFEFGIVYFFTLAAFSVTVEIIRARKPDYFEFLYGEGQGYIGRILMGWAIMGAVILILGLGRINRNRLKSNKAKV